MDGGATGATIGAGNIAGATSTGTNPGGNGKRSSFKQCQICVKRIIKGNSTGDIENASLRCKTVGCPHPDMCHKHGISCKHCEDQVCIVHLEAHNDEFHKEENSNAEDDEDGSEQTDEDKTGDEHDGTNGDDDDDEF